MKTASQLFYAKGMTATGIDTITAKAGVAKMSLYNNFSSKEDLMLAYINARHQEWLELYRSCADNNAPPADGVLAVFDAYIDHAEVSSPDGFRGCGLLNAAAELPAGAAGREAVRRHKAEVQSILASHLGEITSRERAQETAEHLALLLEGAVSLAGLDSHLGRLEQARDIARRIIEAL
ncbi:TetR/AcrR family transcriptional regulator [Corynebacterium halotolerans]|uniref:TetR family transcriptional regulator n=1 Tax=Corynebacterium halotolerans YIM 70093 = DSM 44683 TaxID=1121362 RepID=M1P1H3_9CORY|nr:TetR/AcrR family transcriptional regulator [Corynebacterium halotolerans]AGF73650.1 TetR family transcriptional regulator [Corynebacterium halotolerans YIM 70093 = DSM 44683]